MTDDRISQLLRRANELDDAANAATAPKKRDELASVAELYRKLAAQEMRLLGEMAGDSRK